MRVVDRDSHSAAYAKSWDAIEAYLAVAGATETVLTLEERALVAGLRADANRLANADHANLVRQSSAARAQLDAARALRERGALDALAPSLMAAAELRLRHPSLSLRELAARADPPVTKAAMAGRLARLVALARDDAEAPGAPG
jgi:DNA-binding protein WhiA